MLAPQEPTPHRTVRGDTRSGLGPRGTQPIDCVVVTRSAFASMLRAPAMGARVVRHTLKKCARPRLGRFLVIRARGALLPYPLVKIH